ncbi:hypothetical protein Micbo1qcDRAFT_208151 [Microdochium bolleyi]|uniref:EthD domain-containing protein n=1 Tax=Microdochium bolleyi TaxID=196109 RepID=A0A136IRH7_9PEZI|nr:hypothetical protein Micbo1qcDRAFT_208151 [Microdochium bolleyi]
MEKVGLTGPGILWSASRIRKPDQLDWDSFLKWYEGDLIPQALAIDGFHSCFRGVVTDYGVERPNIVVLATQDLKVFDSPEFSVISDSGKRLMAGTAGFYDVLDFDNRWYSLISVSDHGKKPLAETKSFMTVGWDIKGDLAESVVDNWFEQHHCPQLAKIPGFIRTTRFRAQHTRWSAGNGAQLPCPDFFEIMEFETPDIDVMTIIEHADQSEEGQRIQNEIMESCHFEFARFSMEGTWGKGPMFEQS